MAVDGGRWGGGGGGAQLLPTRPLRRIDQGAGREIMHPFCGSK